MSIPEIAKSSYRSVNNLINTAIGQKKVAMLHPGRCGSTVVARMLNDHPKVFWAGEIFENYMRKEKELSQKEFVKDILDRSVNSRISQFYGFETKYLSQQHLSEECIDLDIGSYVNTLKEEGFSTFIVMHRKNYLRRLVSAMVGKKTKVWHSENAPDKPVTLVMDTNNITLGTSSGTLKEIMDHIDQSFNNLREILQDEEVLYLYYEDHVLPDPRIAYQKICDFLEIKGQDPSIALRKTNPFSYEEIIENFQEVEKQLKGTKYEWMLDKNAL